MPRVLWIALCLLFLPAAGVAGGRDVFESVLQGLANELDRQQFEAARQQSDATALYNACMAGSGPACDLAVTNRWLSARARQAVRVRMREIDTQREAQVQAHQRFTGDWSACAERDDAAACARALDYPDLSENDRRRLRDWQADIAARALARQREAEAATAAAARPVPEPQPEVRPVATPVNAQPVVTGSVPDNGRAFVSAALVLAVFAAIVAAVIWLVPGTMPPPQRSSDSTLAASPAVSVPEFMPLTGDFPTDVRRMLAG